MGVPEPPNRRERKAVQYLDDLKVQCLTDPLVPVEDEESAQMYAWALVVVALFDESERELFEEVYGAYTDGECLYELRTACACEGKDQLCLILDQIMADKTLAQRMGEYMMACIRNESWRKVQSVLKKNRFQPESFLWWSYDLKRYL
ncbi:MAG: hypothetical protein P1S60_15100 [Anaerolineae bacterium]|nr:hypothetical protein [Anaerolineae bacterium]